MKEKKIYQRKEKVCKKDWREDGKKGCLPIVFVQRIYSSAPSVPGKTVSNRNTFMRWYHRKRCTRVKSTDLVTDSFGLKYPWMLSNAFKQSY